MTVSKARGDKAVADLLFSRLVRARGACESCGERRFDLLQTAHIIGRRYAATRTREDNAFCLCASEHVRFTDHPDEWMAFIDAKIGRDKYLALKRDAEAGLSVSSSAFWRDERDRLAQLCHERSIDTRRSAPGWHLELGEAS